MLYDVNIPCVYMYIYICIYMGMDKYKCKYVDIVVIQSN